MTMPANATPELGDKVKDRISGFTGIVTACVHKLEGTEQVQVTPEQTAKDNSWIEPQWLPFNRVEILEQKAYEPAPKAKAVGG